MQQKVQARPVVAAGVTILHPVASDPAISILYIGSVRIIPFMGTTITSVALQIDGMMLEPIWPALGQTPPCPGTVSFTLNEGHCPEPGTYTLAVYAWDSNGDVGVGFSTFDRA